MPRWSQVRHRLDLRASQVRARPSCHDFAQANVTKTLATLADAQENLTDAKAALDDLTLTSPVTGVVTAVTGAVGQSTGAATSAASGGSGAASATGSSSAFVTISSLAKMQVAATFDEADAARLEVGQAATVTFPAVDDVTAEATVTALDPVGSTSGSVVTFGATITLDAVPDGVRRGQTASVTVTTESATDVVAVSSQAVEVSTTADGVTTGSVTVQATDGSTSVRTVEIGVQGDSLRERRGARPPRGRARRRDRGDAVR